MHFPNYAMVFENNCSMCHCQFNDKMVYFHHVRLSHQRSNWFRIQCQIPGCERIFIRYSSFKTHWFKHHSRPVNQREALADNESTVNVAVYVAEKNLFSL